MAKDERRFGLTRVYVRVVALLLIAAGLARAAIVLGITLDGTSFVTLDRAARAGSVTLLLLDLFAGVGLWIGAGWGAVMWTVALVVEIAMHTIFKELFGTEPLRVAMHAALYAIFLVLLLLDWRRAAAE
ncbi:DUF6163 family protein [Propylenella binzhouense]|uniref:Uncharacterized protein n=1 Tax=Propylenella binzhouense TaxID=2555902 RepID=A0A964WS82_9HYPH|nr:DUF6163 family protein [Propylenella binzhouense]MYZ46698.1 hypothetical protein [Propylenella binzhouense]